MAHWYLVSSLPYLHFGEKPEMDVAAFRAACIGHVSVDEGLSIEAILDNREPPVGAASAWWNGEVQLRNAVVRIRAKRHCVNEGHWLRPYTGFSGMIEEMVTDAFSRPNPLEQEMTFDRVRWILAEEMASLTNPFGLSVILAFAVKVRIAEHWASLTDEMGRNRVKELIEMVQTEDQNA